MPVPVPAPKLADIRRIYGREQFTSEYQFVVDYGPGKPIVVQRYSMN